MLDVNQGYKISRTAIKGLERKYIEKYQIQNIFIDQYFLLTTACLGCNFLDS